MHKNLIFNISGDTSKVILSYMAKSVYRCFEHTEFLNTHQQQLVRNVLIVVHAQNIQYRTRNSPRGGVE